MPGIRVSGHGKCDEDDAVACLCGWREPATTKRQRRNLYASHIATAKPAIRRVCARCKEPKRPDEMAVNRTECKRCSTARAAEWKLANPERSAEQVRRSWLRRKYGITPEEFDAKFAGQGGVCAICGEPPDDPRGYNMHVDHCHQTGRVRGILCGSCNRGLGAFHDSVRKLASAIEYIRTHS